MVSLYGAIVNIQRQAIFLDCKLIVKSNVCRASDMYTHLGSHVCLHVFLP